MKRDYTPSLSLDQIRQDPTLNGLWEGNEEDNASIYFIQNAFPLGRSDCLQRDTKLPMAKYIIPDIGSAERGSLWVATNECLGGSASSCVNVTEHLNNQLRKHNLKAINSAMFSIALNGTEAGLYITWKHNHEYHMASVENFLFHRLHHYLEFYKYVQNIINWGENERLQSIQGALDSLLEEEKKVSEAKESSEAKETSGAEETYEAEETSEVKGRGASRASRGGTRGRGTSQARGRGTSQSHPPPLGDIGGDRKK